MEEINISCKIQASTLIKPHYLQLYKIINTFKLLYLYNVLLNKITKEKFNNFAYSNSLHKKPNTSFCRPKLFLNTYLIYDSLTNSNKIRRLNSNKDLSIFLSQVSNFLLDNLKKGYNHYIFSTINETSIPWNINLSTLFIRSKNLKKFQKIASYFFFKNKINTIISLNFNSFRFLQVLNRINVVKIGFIDNIEIHANYHYYYTLCRSQKSLYFCIYLSFYKILTNYFNKIQNEKQIFFYNKLKLQIK